MDLFDKLKILSDAAKYDASCASSGSNKTRGGKGLVGLVQTEARVPVFAHLEGICHVYADADADLDKARRVVLNAKTRRTGICGAAECLLIDRAFLARHGAVLVQDLLDAFEQLGVIHTKNHNSGHLKIYPLP